MKLYDIVEQTVVFDGEPNFLPTPAALYLLNHHAYGSIEEAREDWAENPKKFRVRMTVKYEEVK